MEKYLEKYSIRNWSFCVDYETIACSSFIVQVPFPVYATNPVLISCTIGVFCVIPLMRDNVSPTNALWSSLFCTIRDIRMGFSAMTHTGDQVNRTEDNRRAVLYDEGSRNALGTII